MSRHLALPAGAAAIALVIGLSACTPSDSDDRSAGRDGAPAGAGSSSPADASESGGGLPVGPLDDYLGVGISMTIDADDAEYREYEEAIARCMAAEGFEYVPYIPDVDTTFLPDGTMTLEENEPAFPDLPPDEFAARFGYGISTKPPAAAEEDVDPNEAIVARMSVAERVAYHQALYGNGNTLDDQGYIAGTGMSSSETSCVGRADAGEPTTEERASTQRRVERVQASFKSLLGRVRDLRDQQLEDPRVATATTTWSSCLAAAGHPGFTDLDQPRARALDDARRLLGRDLTGAADADPARLAALRSDEVELAVADEQCVRDWRETFRLVKQDLEERFVRDNLAELEDLRSAMSAAGADQE